MPNTARGVVDQRILYAGLSFFALLVVIFAGTRTYELVRGPHIELDHAEILTSIDGSLTLSGTVQGAQFFYLNGRPVIPEVNGSFEEKLFMTPGHTIMRLTAVDRYERTINKEVAVYISNHAKEKINTIIREANQEAS